MDYNIEEKRILYKALEYYLKGHEQVKNILTDKDQDELNEKQRKIEDLKTKLANDIYSVELTEF